MTIKIGTFRSVDCGRGIVNAGNSQVEIGDATFIRNKIAVVHENTSVLTVGTFEAVECENGIITQPPLEQDTFKDISAVYEYLGLDFHKVNHSEFLKVVEALRKSTNMETTAKDPTLLKNVGSSILKGADLTSKLLTIAKSANDVYEIIKAYMK